MKANELRIGNLVERKETSEVIKIIAISQNTVRTNRGTLPYNCLQPIPLTEEWLLKFGFDRRTEPYEKWYVDDRVAYSLFGAIQAGDEFILPWDDESYILCLATLDNGCESYEVLRRIQHVHQLQNLYFALTGEELTLKS